MEKIRVAINGFGRIGRITLRQLMKNERMEVVAINDLADNKTLAHLFKYDSIHRQYQGTVDFDEENLIVDGHSIKILTEKYPAKLPWKALQIDVVIEATGNFVKK